MRHPYSAAERMYPAAARLIIKLVGAEVVEIWSSRRAEH